jgi:hypothetical protein
MTSPSFLRSTLRWLAGGTGLAAAAYAVYVGVTWSRYGRPPRPTPDEYDAPLDRFMPVYDVVERHHIHIGAPADVTLAVAREMDLFDVPIVQAVFKGRELILRAAPDRRPRSRALLEDLTSLGWVILAETHGEEIVVGAAAKPWEPNVTFHSVPAEAFAAFDEPGFVKIV